MTIHEPSVFFSLDLVIIALQWAFVISSWLLAFITLVSLVSFSLVLLGTWVFRKLMKISSKEEQSVYRKSWTLDAWSKHLDSGRLDSRHLDAWNLDNWTLGLWTIGHLDAWTLDDWTLGLWTLGLWTLGPKIFYQFLVTSISFLLLFTVELLSISNALWLIFYGSIKIAMNSCYNSNLLQLIF